MSRQLVQLTVWALFYFINGRTRFFGRLHQLFTPISTLVMSSFRTRMAPSPATGLVGLEENVFVADFFDRLGFFPMATQR